MFNGALRSWSFRVTGVTFTVSVLDSVTIVTGMLADVLSTLMVSFNVFVLSVNPPGLLSASVIPGASVLVRAIPAAVLPSV